MRVYLQRDFYASLGGGVTKRYRRVIGETVNVEVPLEQLPSDAVLAEGEYEGKTVAECRKEGLKDADVQPAPAAPPSGVGKKKVL